MNLKLWINMVKNYIKQKKKVIIYKKKYKKWKLKKMSYYKNYNKHKIIKNKHTIV